MHIIGHKVFKRPSTGFEPNALLSLNLLLTKVKVLIWPPILLIVSLLHPSGVARRTLNGVLRSQDLLHGLYFPPLAVAIIIAGTSPFLKVGSTETNSWSEAIQAGLEATHFTGVRGHSVGLRSSLCSTLLRWDRRYFYFNIIFCSHHDTLQGHYDVLIKGRILFFSILCG